MDEERLEYLINGFCDGTLDAAESQELACWIEGSDEARRAFVRAVDVHQRLQEWYAVAGAPMPAEVEAFTAAADIAVAEERPSSPYLRELMQRYVTGVLEPMEAEALQVLIRDDEQARAELRRVCEALGMPVPETELAKAETAKVLAVARRGTASGRKSSLRLEPASKAGPALPRRARLLAAACVVALTGGLLWLGIAVSRMASYEREEAERRGDVQRRLDELEWETGALRAAQVAERQVAAPRPLPAEASPEVSPAGDALVGRAVAREEPGRGQDADAELARLLELRRRALLAELAGPKPKRQDEPDEESEAPVAKAEGAVPLPARAAAEVGRVVFVEAGPHGAVLVRGKENQTTRTRLVAGTALRRGDHIEVEPSGGQVFAAVELQGGTTLDLSGGTAVRLLDRDEVRLDCGQVYAAIAVAMPRGEEAEYATPFSIQTPAARYLTQQARLEIFASPLLSAPLTRARVDSGKVHLLNAKGHVIGHRGQEVTARAATAPAQAGEFSGPIWRGRDLPFPGLPFGRSNPLIWQNENPTSWFSEEYALALIQAGVLNVRAFQITQGGDQHWGLLKLRQEMHDLVPGLRNPPEVTLGATRRLQRPASGRPEDTRPEVSPAARQIVSEAHKARPEQPLLVGCPYSMTDLASAWLLDRSCADRVIVLKDLSGKMDGDWIIDPWAGFLVLSHYRCVILPGAVSLTVDLPRLARAPDPRWRFLGRKAGNSDPDFATLALAAMPGFVQEAERASVVFNANDDFQYRPDPAGRLWVVRRADWQLMMDEFHRTFLDSEGSRQGGTGQ